MPKVVDVPASDNPQEVEKALSGFRGSLITFLGEIKKHEPGWGVGAYYRFLIQDQVVNIQ